MVGLPSPICSTGTLETSYFRMFGGNIPGGMPRRFDLRIGNHLRLGQLDARSGVEIDPDHRHAVVGLATRCARYR